MAIQPRITIGPETVPKKEIEKTEDKEQATTKKLSDILSSNNYPTITNFAIVIAIIATIIIATLTLSKFLDANVLKNDWYRIIVGATATICLIGWVQKKIQIESANTICKIVLGVSILMLILNTIWPWTTLDGIREKFKKPPPIATPDQLQIVPQVSYGWKVDSKGNMVANLQPGEEATRPFHLNEGFSTPWLVLPQYHYSLGFTNQQTIIVDEKFKQTVVHPKDHYSMGTIVGGKKLRFTALKGGADIIVNIKRLKK